jgi:hypothetical protein
MQGDEEEDKKPSFDPIVNDVEEEINPRKVHRGRKVLCIGLVILALAAVIVGCISLVLLFRHESLLHGYHRNVTQVDYPEWLQGAIRTTNVVHLEGGRTIRLSANAILWIFEKTDYNTSTGLQSVSNSGLLARQDLMTGEITSAAFIVNAQGHPQPVISLTDQQVKQGFEVLPLASVFVDNMPFQYLEVAKGHIVNGTREYIHEAFGLSYYDNFFDRCSCSQNSSAPEQPTVYFKRAFNDTNSNRARGPMGSIVHHSTVDYIYFFFLYDFYYKDQKNEVYVARMPATPRELINPELTFKFWKEADIWGAFDQAKPVVYDHGYDIDLQWNGYLSAYVMLDPGVNNTIRLRTSPDPYLSWSDAIGVHDYVGTGFIDSAQFHPELSEDAGRVIYITYTVVDELDSHRLPYLLRIELSKKGDGGVI